MRAIFRILLLLLIPTLLQAHQIAEMQLKLEIDGNKLRGTIETDAAYMLPDFRGDEQQDPKDLVWLRGLGPEGWKRIEVETDKYWHESLRLEADGKEVPFKLDIPELHEKPPAFMKMGEPEELPFIEVVVEGELPAGTHKLDAIWHEPYDVVLVTTIRQGADVTMKPLVSGERMTLAEVKVSSAGAAELKPTEYSLHQFIFLGFDHILPQGIDHILFVLGLFLLAPRWKPLLQQTIAFTIAHSITLAVAALGWIKLPPGPVEIMVAASIAWVGIENLVVKDLGKGRVALVGAFGLIHGFGFAGTLQKWLPANQPDKLPGALFGFNLGVELGQIATLLIAFAATFVILNMVKTIRGNKDDENAPWDQHFIWIRRIGSVVVGLAGLLLIAERLFGTALK
ncbi:HupE/UreJ family protein [Haloferula sp. BvORR071]|uniref:HupE/UreJ family protein n=1 Tax=Haloferula sp. BvORR071 TaxID=1396141 RepID=UPI000B1435D3|nr:HupE/UreJ family protein [Haloferula sp. BvORR071]